MPLVLAWVLMLLWFVTCHFVTHWTGYICICASVRSTPEVYTYWNAFAFVSHWGLTTFDLADVYGGFTYEKIFGGGTPAVTLPFLPVLAQHGL